MLKIHGKGASGPSCLPLHADAHGSMARRESVKSKVSGFETVYNLNSNVLERVLKRAYLF